ncbi:MAG: dNTP triphosphohydrolase [Spirochaetes bacterium]|jgi:dGTPase|nr:dNTP triphosphohydrolase [Spirochaetota bacterium]
MKVDTQFWKNIIITKRLASSETNEHAECRSAFDMDHDRIVYSNFFRRLHDKTQVFPYAPLSNSGQARSRLSHSLEVSCVARSLGIRLGRYLTEQNVDVSPYDIGMILASACLAHDIGNPPFGHSGEYAIQQWALSHLDGALTDSWEKNDIIKFEGNAQGFRILSRLESCQRKGGLRPTITTLAAFMKYPCSSCLVNRAAGNPALKKNGYFKSDRLSFDEVFSNFPIPSTDSSKRAFNRHPLSFLTEAADDICYAVVDLEDAYHLGIIRFEDIHSFLEPIARTDNSFHDEKSYDPDIRIARLRSAAISTLINQVMDVFIEYLYKFQSFEYTSTLIDDVQSAKHYAQIKEFSQDNIYNSSRVLEIECAGFKTIGGLFDIFMNAVLEDSPGSQDAISRRMIPPQYFKRYENESATNDHNILIAELTPYERILSVTDYICGMTDRYAVELYQRLSGIKLPVY